MSSPHTSVLLDEVINSFKDIHLESFADGTLGAGGHAEAFLSVHPEIRKFYGFDQDQTALELSKERLKGFKQVEYIHRNFSEMSEVIPLGSLDGVLVDLGVSSMQFDRAERGFSFQKEGPLDMRMDQSNPLSAYEVVNEWSEEELGRIFREYGEERFWRKCAGFICHARKQQKLQTTADLKKVLHHALGPKREGIDPATRVFQAIRIAVNGELEHLEKFLKELLPLLKPKGRIAIISFHSLEDRMVKQFFQYEADDKLSTEGKRGMFLDKTPTVRIVTRKPIVPTEEEIASNKRARSAKLRVIEKL